jgi:hypothetical protein
LQNGTLLDAGYFIIEIPEKRGTVFIQQISNGFEIEADQPFQLTLPVAEDQNDKVILESVNSTEKKTFTGKVINLEKIKVAVFELPALNRVQLKYQ